MSDARSGSLENVTENVWLRLVARVAMVATPIVATIFSWSILNYLDTRFDALNTRVVAVETMARTAAEKADKISERATSLEAITAMGRQTRDQQYAQVLARLDKLADDSSTVKALIAGLTARLDATRPLP